MGENYNKLYEDINKMYPYGDFPYQYTKKQKDSDLNNPHIFNYYTNEKFQKQTKEPLEKEEPQNKHQNFSLNNLLPIISSLSGGKKMDSNTLLSTILPLFAGNKSKEFGAILKLFNNKSQKQNNEINQKTEFPPSDYKPIDTYERLS